MKTLIRTFLIAATSAVIVFGTFQSVTVQAQDLDLLRVEMTHMNTRLNRLRDVSDIEKLQRSYGYYVDKQQWNDVVDLFADNGILEIGGRGRFLGKKRINEYFRTGLGPVGPFSGVLNDHQQLQGIVTVSTDGKSAEGRWTGFVMDNGGWADINYENDYIKQDGVWKISFLHAPYNMQASYDSGWISNTIPNNRPDSFLPAPDLPPTVIYLSYPNYYLEPYHYVNPVTNRPMPPQDPAAGGTAFGN